MIELRCKHCTRYFGEVEAVVGTFKCASCKGTTQFKVLTADQSKMISYKFASPELEPKKKEAEVS